jgi:hypothetical protein
MMFLKMKTKIHIFCENLVPDGEPRTWLYGKHEALIENEVTAIKKLLPEGSHIIQLNFEEPEDYFYSRKTLKS